MSGHTPWSEIKHKREELNVGSGKECSSCGGTVAAGAKTCQNCGHSFAVTTNNLEFGDVIGHDFHGNQYTQAEVEALPEKTIRQVKVGDRVGFHNPDNTFEEVGVVTGKGTSIFEPGKPVLKTDAVSGVRFNSYNDTVRILPSHTVGKATGDEKLDKQLDKIFRGGETLAARVDDVEAAVLALGALEFGDSEGHPFRGNQYGGGGGDRPAGAGNHSGTKETGGLGGNVHPAIGMPKRSAVDESDVPLTDGEKALLDPTVDLQLSRGPSVDVVSQDDWESGVMHAADSLRDEQDTPESLRTSAEDDGEDWTASMSGSPLSDSDSYKQGIIDFLDELGLDDN